MVDKYYAYSVCISFFCVALLLYFNSLLVSLIVMQQCGFTHPRVDQAKIWSWLAAVVKHCHCYMDKMSGLRKGGT